MSSRLPAPWATACLWLILVSPLSGNPAAADSGVDLEERLDRAEAALEARRLPEAEALYRELLALYPHQVRPYQGLAEVLAARGQRDAAVELLLDLGRELIKILRPGEALPPLELALDLAPRRAETLALLGRALAAEGRHEAAVEALGQAVDLGHGELATLLELATSRRELGRFAGRRGDLSPGPGQARRAIQRAAASGAAPAVAGTCRRGRGPPRAGRETAPRSHRGPLRPRPLARRVRRRRGRRRGLPTRPHARPGA